MNHLGIFNTTGDVQTALNQETLVKPYVAKIGSNIDFNSLSPAAPAKGTWTLIQPGFYQFVIDTEADWNNATLISVIPDAWFDDVQGEVVDIKLFYTGAWEVAFQSEDPGASGEDDLAFFDGESIAKTTQFTEVGEESDRCPVKVTWDGINTFVFQVEDTTVATLEMNTINPPYSE